MSGSMLVTLKDGSQVPKDVLSTTTENLEVVRVFNYYAFADLIEKCKNANYQFLENPIQDSKDCLCSYALMDAGEEIDDNVRKIVLNSIDQTSSFPIALVSPIQGKITQY